MTFAVSARHFTSSNLTSSTLVGADLIFVSMEQWDEIWRRNQFLCSEYARRHPDRQVLFVAPAVDVTNAIRRRQLSLLCGPRTWTVTDFPNITVTRPMKLAPNTLAAGRALNEKMARSHVRRLARKLGIKGAILWLNPHTAAHMPGKMSESCVIYDVTDDWTALTQSSHSARLVRDQDARLCRAADAVVVCSQRLYELKGPLARKLYLIPNGVDAEHYGCVLDRASDQPKGVSSLRKPVLGYTGTIHSDRIDVALLDAVARKMPEASIVLVGPNHLSADQITHLKGCGNLSFTGSIPYSEIPDFMREFDVCIVPHRISPFTESLNPIKLWEYLAAGKPIVSTEVAGFRDYPQFVRIARNADEFVAAAREAAMEDLAVAEARRTEARKHSWESRLDQIEAVIEKCLERKTRKSSIDR